MTQFFEENYKEIFQYWLPPTSIKNLSVLDLGSKEGRLGEYCLSNGAKDYIGVEINSKKVLQAQERFPQIKFYNEDLTDFVKRCVHKYTFFDFVVLTRTLHYIQDQIELLENISKITNNIIIESGVPVDRPLLDLVNDFKTIRKDAEFYNYILQIQEHMEYEENFTLHFFNKESIQNVPSIGFLKSVFDQLEFESDLTIYEKLKQIYPSEYGFFYKNRKDDLLGKFVVKFKRVK